MYKIKFLSLHFKNNNQNGFTLIELLVVMIILGVLAAVSIPNFMNQIGKSREAEGKNGIGVINRAQQSYHFEKQTFSPNLADADLEADNPLGVVVTSQYYDFAVTGGSADDARVDTTAKDGDNGKKDGVRQYSGGINHTSGKYVAVVCQADTVGDPAPGYTAGGSCAAGTTLK
ncbi:MAG: type IV pilin-like G/H family protein [Stanieria sp.]